jgi:hypothetical protein
MEELKKIAAASIAVLTVLERVGNIPGVSMIPYVKTGLDALSAVKAGLETGRDVMPFVEEIRETYEGKVPTPEDVQALRDKITALEAKLDAPLPPKEDGEED